MLLTVRNEKPVSGVIPEAFYKTISLDEACLSSHYQPIFSVKR
jgi:hypothetical protein